MVDVSTAKARADRKAEIEAERDALCAAMAAEIEAYRKAEDGGDLTCVEAHRLWAEKHRACMKLGVGMIAMQEEIIAHRKEADSILCDDGLVQRMLEEGLAACGMGGDLRDQVTLLAGAIAESNRPSFIAIPLFAMFGQAAKGSTST